METTFKSELILAIQTVKAVLSQRETTVDRILQKTEQSERERMYVGQETQLRHACDTMLKFATSEIRLALGQIPPNAMDLEEAVIGALIIEKEALRSVYKFLRPEHFYSHKHEVIYETLLMMVGDRIPVDMRTLVLHLRKRGMLDIVGGAYNIADLTSRVSSAANIEYHARIIIEFFIRRKLIEISSDIQKRIYEDQVDVFEALDTYKKMFNDVDEFMNNETLREELELVGYAMKINGTEEA